MIDQMAENIIRFIPDVLKNAAKSAKPCREGLIIVAKIPIVKEEMTSMTDTKGHLSSDKELILQTVEEKLKSVSIFGVTLTVNQETRIDGYTANGLDNVMGPCKNYYIQAKVIV